MSDGSVFLYAERALGRGWIGVQIRGLALPKGSTQVCFSRWGHKQPYLGMQGWQVAETWREVEAVSGEGETIDGVLLSPELTELLEQGSNYKLSIRVDGVTKLDRPVRWGGIATNSLGGRGANVAAAAVDLQNALEEKTWQRVRNDKDEHALIEFIKDYPKTPNILAAQALVQEIAERKSNERGHEADARAWAIAVADDSKTGYETYLRQHPGGAFADEASDALAHFLPHQILIRSSFSNASSSTKAHDLDACVFLLSNQKKVRVDRDFVCSYAIEEGTGASLATSMCGSVTHLGKPKTSQRDLTSESITIDLNQIPADICSIALTVSLDPHAPPQAGLDSIEFAVVEVFDTTTSDCLLSIDFKKGQFGVKGSLIAEIIRRGTDWKILSRERAFEGGIDAMCEYFGVNVQ
jgi:tellurium resistance protein TerD